MSDVIKKYPIDTNARTAMKRGYEFATEEGGYKGSFNEFMRAVINDGIAVNTRYGLFFLRFRTFVVFGGAGTGGSFVYPDGQIIHIVSRDKIQ